MKTAVLICPGRGTYNKGELGLLARTFPDADLLSAFDQQRIESGHETLSDLDGADRFDLKRHTRGDAASGLIYAASFGDFLSINRDKIEIVAVTGNSMGWYSALACGGALSAEAAFNVVNTMGMWMHQDGEGGQLVYPFTNDDWRASQGRKAELMGLIAEIAARDEHALSLSIDLGGLLVIAGNEAGLSAFTASVPKVDRYPMRLQGHAGFHSELVAPVSKRALAHFSQDLFTQPERAMIDGRGNIWWPGATDTEALRNYTFGTQVVKPYDFTHAIRIAAREFAPDYFVVTGPGTTLGGAVAQSLIQANWRGMSSKAEFQQRQSENPLLISMGWDEQRILVTS